MTDMNSVHLIILSFIVLVLIFAVTRLYRNEVKKMFKMQGRSLGLSVGDRFPQNTFRDIHSVPIDIFHPKLKGSIMVFTSLTCNACKSVYPFLSNYQAKHPDIKVVNFTAGDKDGILANIDEYKLTVSVIAINQDDLIRYGVSSIPFAYFVTTDGRIAAKSVVNYEEHLDSMVGTAQFSVYTKSG